MKTSASNKAFQKSIGRRISAKNSVKIIAPPYAKTACIKPVITVVKSFAKAGIMTLVTTGANGVSVKFKGRLFVV